MPANEPLSRSSLEAYGAIVLGVVTVACPMTWWLCLFLFAIVAGLAADVCWRASWFATWSRTARVILAAIAVALTFGFGAWRAATLYPHTLAEAAPSPIPPIRQPKTFRQLYDTDFPTMAYLGNVMEMVDKSNKIIARVPVKIHYDYATHSKFISIFLPEGDVREAYKAASYYASHIANVLAFDKQEITFSIQRKDAGDSDAADTSKFTFSNLVYLYSIPEMTLEQKADIFERFKANGTNVIFRGSEYYATHAL